MSPLMEMHPPSPPSTVAGDRSVLVGSHALSLYWSFLPPEIFASLSSPPTSLCSSPLPCVRIVALPPPTSRAPVHLSVRARTIVSHTAAVRTRARPSLNESLIFHIEGQYHTHRHIRAFQSPNRSRAQPASLMIRE
jgi:hypothetical protein